MLTINKNSKTKKLIYCKQQPVCAYLLSTDIKIAFVILNYVLVGAVVITYCIYHSKSTFLGKYSLVSTD